MRLRLLALFSSKRAVVAAVCVALSSYGLGQGIAGVTLRGRVQGAGAAVTNASVQLYAAGHAGYGRGETPLLAKALLSDATGAFLIAGNYVCPAADSELYVVVTGGNPGLPAGTENAAIAMMAALGPCNELTAKESFTVNEVTTVAAVYALRPFLRLNGGHVGTSASNAIGLADAFATVTNLVDKGTGVVRRLTPAGSGTVPRAAMNTLGNLLATCVRTDGTGSPCFDLFAAATPPGQVSPPTDTLQAALDIANNPSNHVSTLYALAPMSAKPYALALKAVPNDWTLSVNYTGHEIGFPAQVAVDAEDNIWATNALDFYDYEPPSLVKLSNAGVPLSGPLGFVDTRVDSPVGLAIDASGSPWVTSYTQSVTKYNSMGQVLWQVNPLGPGVSHSAGDVVIDPWDRAWVLDGDTYTVTLLNQQGAVLSGAGGYAACRMSPCQVFQPTHLTLDQVGNAYIPNRYPGSVVELSPSGGVLSPEAGFDVSSGYANYAVEDGRGVLWVGRAYSAAGDNVQRVGQGGSVLSTTTGGAFAEPVWIAIDGVGDAWVLSYGKASLAHLNGKGALESGANGFLDKAPLPTGYCSSPPYGQGCPIDRRGRAVAIDNAGAAWVANADSLTEYVGVAEPVVTPITVALREHKVGQRP